MKKICIVLLLLSTSVLWGQDLTKKIEFIGNPAKDLYPEDIHARNIWDMQSYKKKIYFGLGCTAFNTGPTKMMCINTSNDRIISEFIFDDHAIYRIRKTGNSLYVPGSDDIETGDSCNFYIFRNHWIKKRKLPGVVHSYDLDYFQNKLYLTGGLRTGKAFVSVSDNYGDTWRIAEIDAFRGYSFFQLNNKLYLSTLMMNTYEINDTVYKKSSVDWYKGCEIKEDERFDFTTATIHKPISYDKCTTLFLIRRTSVIARKDTTNIEYIPVQLSVATSEKNNISVEKISLDGLPYDILVRNKTIYILVCKLDESLKKYKISVYNSKNLKSWKELFYFYEGSFARSFEIVDGSFYFGLGCNLNDLNEYAGRIIRISKSDIKTK